MKDLFTLDLADYYPIGNVVTRPSARGVIYQDGKVLLIYAEKYGYYKFPGGGIEAGEDPLKALCREVREETGYEVIPESVEEYGRVLRRQKDSHNEYGIFEQENLYFFCQVKEVKAGTSLEAYEKEHGFMTVWVDPMEASSHNRHYKMDESVDPVMVKREAKVLDLVDLEIRKRERAKKEALYIEALGSLDYATMLAFVGNELMGKNTECMGAKIDIDYCRFEHTKRVLGWTKRIYDLTEDKSQLRYEDLIIATIFHDVGRQEKYTEYQSHALAGVPITREYLLSHGFEEERTDYICQLVAKHSDKYLMDEEEVDPNLLLLMEADLMDDMGALGVVMDCMIVEARNSKAHFVDALEHIERYTQRIQKENPMVSKAARLLWDEKTRIVNEFTNSLNQDVLLQIV